MGMYLSNLSSLHVLSSLLSIFPLLSLTATGKFGPRQTQTISSLKSILIPQHYPNKSWCEHCKRVNLKYFFVYDYNVHTPKLSPNNNNTVYCMGTTRLPVYIYVCSWRVCGQLESEVSLHGFAYRVEMV